jgi:hypothetical protein
LKPNHIQVQLKFGRREMGKRPTPPYPLALVVTVVVTVVVIVVVVVVYST